MARIFIFLCLVALDGCHPIPIPSPQQACVGMGYEPGTGLFLNCVNSVVGQRQQETESYRRYQAQTQFKPTPLVFHPVAIPTANMTSCYNYGSQITCSSY